MARYTISYDGDRTEVIDVDRIQIDGDQYIGYKNNTAVAYIPVIAVLSVVHEDAEVTG